MAKNGGKTIGLCWSCGVVGVCLLVVTAGALAADPNNAALLYYQALLLRPEPDDHRMIEDVLRGGEPSDRLREYLESPFVQEAVALAEGGMRISNCDWGCKRAGGMSPNTLIMNSTAVTELVRLRKLLLANARLLGHDGKHRAALEKCLALRQFAAHLNDDSVMLYAVAYETEGRALQCMQQILGSMPPKADTLVWLRDQLKTVQGIPWEPAEAIRRQHDAYLDNKQRMLSEYGGNWKKWFIEEITDESAKERVRRQTENELLAQARETYMQTLESAIDVIESDVSVESRYEALALLDREIAEQAAEGKPVGLLRGCWEGLQQWLHDVSARALWYNSTLVAIEVYLIKARTGQLPATLPKGLPKAPYTGSDFEYERRDDGFVLRFLKKDYSGRKMRDLNFRVTKP